MKKIAVVMTLLITLLLSGCISDESPPTATTIILNEENPAIVVTANSDNKKVTWSVDGEKIATVEKIDTPTFVLNYRNFTAGNHTLKLADSEDSAEWRFSISNEGMMRSVAIINDSRGYDSNTSWAERHRIAREKLNASKQIT